MVMIMWQRLRVPTLMVAMTNAAALANNQLATHSSRDSAKAAQLLPSAQSNLSEKRNEAPPFKNAKYVVASGTIGIHGLMLVAT